jgi:excisionase family DNA binding protein
MEKYYTLKETCQILKIGRGALYELIRNAEIKAFNITPGKRAIRKEELQRYLKEKGITLETSWKIKGKFHGEDIEVISKDIEGLKVLLTYIKKQDNSDGVIVIV